LVEIRSVNNIPIFARAMQNIGVVNFVQGMIVQGDFCPRKISDKSLLGQKSPQTIVPLGRLSLG
jgi:hypothetical protein